MADAPELMIDAAERLIAEGGMGALTVQAVQAAAGQKNKSAVQYHFGGRQGLVNALLESRMAPANERRTAMILELGEQATTRDLVEVMILPLVEPALANQPSYWARCLVQALNDPASGLAALDAVDGQALQVAQSRLEERLDHVSAEVRTLRVQSMLGYVCVVLAAYEVGILPLGVSPDTLATELVDACCGLLAAPSTTTRPDSGDSTQGTTQ